jgi:hypothetical protein
MKIVSLAISWILVTAGIASAAWVSETVASNGDVGNYNSVLVDHWGRPHVAYYDKTNSLVVYARYNGASWVLQTVASGVTLMGNISLAFDSNEQPYVAFWDSTSKDLKYCYKSGSTWTSEAVANGNGYGLVTSLAITGAGPVLAFTAGASFNFQVKYAYRDTSWHTETVSTNSSSGQFMSMCVDSNGVPHIVYSDGTRGVVHSMRSGTTWTSPIIIGTGTDCDLTYGPDSYLHVAFCQKNGAGLVYAKSTDGNTWDTEAVTPTTTVCGYPHIVLNGSSMVFISYFDWTSHDLHAAIREGGTWNKSLVAGSSYIGNSHDMAVNGTTSYPYISYYDNDPADMKVAHYNESGIDLRALAARRAGDGVDVTWSLARATDDVRFNVYRGVAGTDGKPTRLNAALVTGQSPYRFRDRNMAANSTYQYWIEAVELSGATEIFGPAVCKVGSQPSAFALSQNYPNPARSTTKVSFSLPAAGDAELAIYDTAGRKVTTAFAGSARAGANVVSLDVSRLAPGVYTYRLRAGGNEMAKRMVIGE